MDIHLWSSGYIQSAAIQVSGSKSETNRLLLLKALFPGIQIQNVSDSDDSAVMTQALYDDQKVIDVHHAGTAMRFLTAYFAAMPGKEVVLTGSQRMKERPIKILVNALQELGAEIEYLGAAGYPPLKIIGKEISKNKVSLAADVSSQYITALLLIAAKLKNGLELTLEGEITSVPYINMTLGLLNEVGIDAVMNDNHIIVKPAHEPITKTVTIESDWSSASYFYSIIALTPAGTKIELSSYKQNSLQGDSALVQIYSQLGIETVFKSDSIILQKQKEAVRSLILDLNNTPDIAQTIAVTCFGLGIDCHLTGLHTLKIKETDRLVALKNELVKLGATVNVTHDNLTLKSSGKINTDIFIETYNDHRMAMAFAPLAVKTPLIIKDAGVVSKSYPAFWDDIAKLGIQLKTL